MVRKLLSGWLVVGAVLMAGVLAGWAAGALRGQRTGDIVLVAIVLGSWGLIYAVIAVLAIVDAVRLGRQAELDQLSRSANAVKRFAIPFFILNFCTATLLAGAATWLGLGHGIRQGLGGPLLALLFVVLTYLVLLPTSAYGVAAVLVLRRRAEVGSVFVGLTVVGHLLFITDIISSIVVVEVARHQLGEVPRPTRGTRQLLTGLFAVFSGLALIWIVLVIISTLAPDSIFVGMAGILTLTPVLALVLIVLIPVAPIVTFRACVRLYLGSDLTELRRLMRPAKIVPIPLFVQNFALCAVVVLAATLLPVAASRGTIIFAGPLAIPIVGAFTSVGLVPTVLGTYLLMLPTSMYGITTLALMMRRRQISPQFCIVNVILHLVFVADIVSTFVVAQRAGAVLQPPARPDQPDRPDR